MIHYYRKMLNIQRLAGTPKGRGYVLAHHSYFTTVLFIDLCAALDKHPTPRQLDLVLKHDFLEVLTADLPYPIKNLSHTTQAAWEVIEEEAVKAYGHIGALSEYTDGNLVAALGDLHEVFKAADLLELWTFCVEEQVMGNSTVAIESVVNKCEELIGAFSPLLSQACLHIMHKVIAAGREMDSSKMAGFKTAEESPTVALEGQ